jgi:hypothetical protein
MGMSISSSQTRTVSHRHQGGNVQVNHKRASRDSHAHVERFTIKTSLIGAKRYARCNCAAASRVRVHARGRQRRRALAIEHWYDTPGHNVCLGYSGLKLGRLSDGELVQPASGGFLHPGWPLFLLVSSANLCSAYTYHIRSCRAA